MTPTNDKAISEVIQALLGESDRDAEAMYDCVRDNAAFKPVVDAVDSSSIESVFFSYFYPVEQLMLGLVRHANAFDSHKAQWLLSNYTFVESNFAKLFEQIEGSACHADKSRTVVNALFRYYMHDKPISFNYEGEYTNHLPTTIFRTQDEILTFFKALNELYYGNFTTYVKAIANYVPLIAKKQDEDRRFNELCKSAKATDAVQFDRLWKSAKTHEEVERGLLDIVKLHETATSSRKLQ